MWDKLKELRNKGRDLRREIPKQEVAHVLGLLYPEHLEKHRKENTVHVYCPTCEHVAWLMGTKTMHQISLELAEKEVHDRGK